VRSIPYVTWFHHKSLSILPNINCLY
ncbi:uncharacterized protein METZ01_LOCUS468504, partial [marine metagenome]